MARKKKPLGDKTAKPDEVISYNEGDIQFKYYPYLGEVFCPNVHSLMLTSHHFGHRGFELAQGRCDISKLKLFVHPPSDMDKVDAYKLIKKTIRELKSERKQKKENLRLLNIDNNTGEPLNWENIKKYISVARTGDKDRFSICKWFNTFNLEDDTMMRGAILEVSTRSKTTVIKQGYACLKRLYEKGLLRRLTPEQYSAKLEEYANKKKVEQEEDFKEE